MMVDLLLAVAAWTCLASGLIIGIVAVATKPWPTDPPGEWRAWRLFCLIPVLLGAGGMDFLAGVLL